MSSSYGVSAKYDENTYYTYVARLCDGRSLDFLTQACKSTGLTRQDWHDWRTALATKSQSGPPTATMFSGCKVTRKKLDQAWRALIEISKVAEAREFAAVISYLQDQAFPLGDATRNSSKAHLADQHQQGREYTYNTPKWALSMRVEMEIAGFGGGIGSVASRPIDNDLYRRLGQAGTEGAITEKEAMTELLDIRKRYPTLGRW